jgi:uncharacterized membrane protein
MANNIKYIRWAAGALKIIMVINIIIGLIGFVGSLAAPVLAAASGSAAGTVVGFSLNIGMLVTIAINAFMTYTAARGLDLLADVAYHLLMTWHKQAGNNS